MGDVMTRAAVLIEALPYIKRFYGKTVVLKYGGKAMTTGELKEHVIKDVVLMRYVGMNPVVVHGGGPEITSLMERLGKRSSFVDGLRVTDRETVDIAEMVLGKINKEIVGLINLHGGRAVGLSGKDGSLLRARKREHRRQGGDGPATVDLGFVGDVETVNPHILETVIQAGYIPVVAPVACGEDGETYNVNADAAAGAVAAALRAEKLVLLTDVEGIYRRQGESESLLSEVTAGEVRDLIARGVIDGGMIPKVEACLAALTAGVGQAHIINGCVPHALLLEIFTDAGIGTMMVGEGRKGTG